jgi:endonuclease YncB( thermonuclease family)
MLGWSRKSEGSDIRRKFEQRREQIRQRVLSARRAVGPRIQAAAAATAAGLRAGSGAVLARARAGRGAATLGLRRAWSGLAATGAKAAFLGTAAGAVRAGARTARDATVVGARRTLTGLAAFGAISGQRARTARGAVAHLLARPGIVGTVAAAGAMALGAGIGRYRAAGFDSEAVALLAVGGGLMAILLPTVFAHLSVRFPALADHSALLGTAAVAVAMLGAASLWAAYRDTPGVASLAGSPAESKEVAGRALAVAGDLLKVAGTTVRLSDIEAPERAQICGKDNARWRCADAAQSALLKVVSGPTVRCRLSGTDKAGIPRGHCSIESVDINAELVRQGFVFADGGASSRYAAQEADARNARLGVWIADTQRPAEFRAKAWEEAKRRAPDGCPIKGQVTGAERVYVLPGTPSYDRLRVLASRGDRWFCSEQDAAAAGFKAAQRG